MGSGRDSYVGWGQEGTWGSPVAATMYAELKSEGVKGIRQREARPVFRGLHRREGNTYDVKVGATGPVVIEMTYEGLLRLLEHGIGSVATAADTPVAGAHEHTFTLAAGELMAGKGLSLEVGKALGAANAFQMQGGKVKSLKLIATPGENLSLELDFVGEQLGKITETSPTFPSPTLLVAGHQTTVEIDDIVRGVDSVEFTIDNGLDDDKRILGSKAIDEPVRSDTRPALSGILTVDGVIADWDKFDVGSAFKLEILSASTIFIAGATPYASELTLLKCVVNDDPVGVSGPGIVKSTIPFVVEEPTSGAMLSWLIRSGEAAVA